MGLPPALAAQCRIPLIDARLGFDDLMRSVAHRQGHKGRGPERQLPLSSW